ncbi:MAG: riboflavin biosynthesis protein RibF [Synergistaceae bacterium]
MIFSVGAFDGFHIGHIELLKMAQKRAAERGDKWGVITFQNHPQLYFKNSKFRYLFSDEERDLVLKYLSVEYVHKIFFNSEIALMTPEQFINYLASNFDVSGLVVGENFRFAKDRLGTNKILQHIAAEHSWSFDIVPSYMIGKDVVCSSLIREKVSCGEIREANKLQGFPYVISGYVIKGKGRGKILGFPTANIAHDNYKLYPAYGSYIGFTFIDHTVYPVALNIGFNPTFSDMDKQSCEAHIVGFNGNLYNKKIFVFIIKKIRNEKKYESKELLITQLSQDINYTKKYFNKYLKNNIKQVQNILSKNFDI